jgi:hypothetical protein
MVPIDRSAEGRKLLLELLGEAGQRPVEEVVAALAVREIGVDPGRDIATALARPEEFVEPFLAALAMSPAEVDQRMDAVPDDRHAYFLHTFAIYLLGLWQEPRAFQPLVAYLAADSHLAHEQLGDMVTEDLHTILARTWDGSDLAPLKGIIEAADGDAFVRVACLKSLHVLIRSGRLPRADVVAYYRRVAGLWRDDPDAATLLDLLIPTLAELQEPGLRPLIDSFCTDRSVDEMLFRPSDIDATYAETPDEIDERLIQHDRFHDLADYLCGWAWFHASDPAELADPWDDLDDETIQEMLEREARQPLVREGRKIGRNEPCPCGSGKKYKQCCMADESA